MIYITGDTHGMQDWEKINTTNFPIQKGLTKNDYLIITGDFGGVWDGAEQDRYILKPYSEWDFTTLFTNIDALFNNSTTTVLHYWHPFLFLYNFRIHRLAQISNLH